MQRGESTPRGGIGAGLADAKPANTRSMSGDGRGASLEGGVAGRRRPEISRSLEAYTAEDDRQRQGWRLAGDDIGGKMDQRADRAIIVGLDRGLIRCRKGSGISAGRC